MNEGLMISDDEISKTHMNSIQFNEQDHLDLQTLNQKLCDTIKEFTNEGINTEDVIQFQTKTINVNPTSMQIFQQVLHLNEKLECGEEQYTLQNQKQEQLTIQQVDLTTEEKKNPTQFSNIIVFVIFILDMLFTFNTGVVEKGNVIFDRKKAAIIYLKKNFIMDQIALIPLFMFYLDIKLDGLYSLTIYFQILMKLFVLSDTFSRLTYYLSYQKNMKNIVDLVKLVFIIACVCHIFCLFWHGLAVYEINQGSNNTWLQYRGIENADVFTRYVQSFYYLAVTMITVGYGDITPQTTYEILFTTATMFVTGFFYAFSLNRIGTIIENIELKDKSYKENMQVIHRLMREENVSQTLRVQISNYLQYLYKESNEIGKQFEIEITNKLSKQLKYDLTQDIQGKYLQDIEFIDKLESKSKIVEIMEECLFSPGEYIFRQGNIDDCSLYYIVKGSVKITYDYQCRDQTESLILTHVKKSQYFGDMSFIQGNARILTAQASDFCRTYKIPREQFFQCIKESNQDYENFQMLKEAYIFKDNLKLFNMKCYTCNKSDHISIKCPKTHLTLSKQTLIQKENRSTPHLQREFKQRKCNKFNSIFKNFDVINSVYQFIEKDENLLDLQLLEDELHLSLDEAFLEQQLLEIDKQEFNEQFTKEQKNFETSNKTISEAEQEEDSSDEISQIFINDTLFSQKKQTSNTNQSNLEYNQKNEMELVQANSFTERTPSSYQNKEKILSQSFRSKQVKSSIEKIQSSTSNSLLDQPTFQDSYHEQKNQTIEKNSNLSLSTQKHPNKQQQQSSIYDEQIETLENIQSQIQNNLQNNDYNNQNQQKKKIEVCSEKNKKISLPDRQKNFVSKDNSFEKSEELLNHDLLKEAANIVMNKQPTQKIEKRNMFCKKKSQSLKNLCELNDQIVAEQNYINQNSNDFNTKYDIKNYIQDNNLSETNQQILRSQSCREPSTDQSDNELQLKGNKNYLSQSINSQNKAASQNKLANKISSNNQFYEETQQKSNSSLQNGSYSKQNMNINNSQTSLKSIQNNEFVQKREQSSKQILQNQQDLIKQQLKKISQLRQLKLQKRPSQVLSPKILGNLKKKFKFITI